MSSEIKKYGVLGSVLLTIVLISSCTGNIEQKKMEDKKNEDKKMMNEEINTHSDNSDDDSMEKNKVMKIEVIEGDMIKEGKGIKEEMTEEITEKIKELKNEGEALIIEKEMIDDNTMRKTEGVYKEYSEAALVSAQGNIVLFFAASWCPSCKTADKNLSSEIIPKGLTILKLDYDSNLELRKKYGITSQHTFVLVDNKGDEIKKWYGSRDLEDILEKI